MCLITGMLYYDQVITYNGYFINSIHVIKLKPKLINQKYKLLTYSIMNFSHKYHQKTSNCTDQFFDLTPEKPEPVRPLGIRITFEASSEMPF